METFWDITTNIVILEIDREKKSIYYWRISQVVICFRIKKYSFISDPSAKSFCFAYEWLDRNDGFYNQDILIFLYIYILYLFIKENAI